MPASADNESEILLGNKQLLAIFAVVAFLLAVAFTGGYMLGKNTGDKKPDTIIADAKLAAPATDTPGGPITQKVAPADDQAATKTDVPLVDVPPTTPAPVAETKPVPAVTKPENKSEPATKPVPPKKAEAKPLAAPVAKASLEVTPKPGQTYVQVGALGRTQAEATADVLRKQNFPAHIAAAPNGSILFRVLVGPLKDAGELTTTRDSLRKIGFREVLVRRY